ncbi:MAG: dihydrodipicolinate synthase family protein [Planctomycetes bacterium]|nr:dihydrodipicolinate synthase family protein [Planctomycetota bacterium]
MARQELTSGTLCGVWPALIVPWREDDRLDEERFRSEVRSYAGTGVGGVYTGGTTGEFYAQDDATFERIAAIACEEAHSAGLPVQIGCTALSSTFDPLPWCRRINAGELFRPGLCRPRGWLRRFDQLLDPLADGVHRAVVAHGREHRAVDVPAAGHEPALCDVELDRAAELALDELGLDQRVVDRRQHRGLERNACAAVLDFQQLVLPQHAYVALQRPRHVHRHVERVFPRPADGHRLRRKDDEKIATRVVGRSAGSGPRD